MKIPKIPILFFLLVFIFACQSTSKLNSDSQSNQDYKSNLATISKVNYNVNVEKSSNWSAEIIPIKIGNSEIKMVKHKTSVVNPYYYTMHDNENTAVDACLDVIGRLGGTFLEIRAQGAREITFLLDNKQYKFDPNRIYSEIGVDKTLLNYENFSSDAVKQVNNFTKNLIKDFFAKDIKMIVAVHNNTDEKYSIKSYEKGQEFGNDAKFVFINPQKDIDDFFFVTEEKYFQFFKEKGFNVALQDNEKVTDDGSLSVYCGKNNIKYINVEAEHNHLEEQIKMLEVLQTLVEK